MPLGHRTRHTSSYVFRRAYFPGAGAPKQYTKPASSPTTSLSLATDTEALMGLPVSNRQVCFPEPRSRPYRLPSEEPTKTRFPTMTGEESMRPLVGKVHRAFPVLGSRAWRSLSRPPMTTTFSVTAADE